jgi:hypothetical protein
VTEEGSHLPRRPKDDAALDRNKKLMEQRVSEIATANRRKQNLPLVRKIGAKICQERQGNIIYVGYVESMTDEKVQIRISDAYYKSNSNVHVNNNSSSIIWDSPLNWDLCE